VKGDNKVKTTPRFLERLTRPSHSTAGQSLVETALVIPILVILLIGGSELAFVMHAAITVSNAAKAGAQYGAQNGFTAQDATGIVNAANGEAGNLTVTTTSSYACVCSDGTSSTCLGTDCSNSHIEQTVTVNSSTTMTPIVQLPFLPKQWTIKRTAVQRCLQ
jgi:Flp pilus assembly protein TadG